VSVLKQEVEMVRPRRVVRRLRIARAAPVGEAGHEPDAPQAVDDAFEQVKQLSELREQGILTEEEFTAEKRRVLGL
jgi:isopropylmalate/homocitrate/citramalate synthase